MMSSFEARKLYESRPDEFFTGIVSNGKEVVRPVLWEELSAERQAEFAAMVIAPTPSGPSEERIKRACKALDKVMDSGNWKDWNAHVRDCVNAVARELAA